MQPEGALQRVWAALEQAERRILTEVTIEHVIKGKLPESVTELGVVAV
jgi:hypothetical protein